MALIIQGEAFDSILFEVFLLSRYSLIVSTRCTCANETSAHKIETFFFFKNHCVKSKLSLNVSALEKCSRGSALFAALIASKRGGEANSSPNIMYLSDKILGSKPKAHGDRAEGKSQVNNKDRGKGNSCTYASH